MIENWDRNLPENEGRKDGMAAFGGKDLSTSVKFSSLKPCT